MYLSLLRRNPAFGRLYAAQLASFAGDWFATVALLGMALEMTGSSAVASLVLASQTGGFALASPLAGIVADRIDRRKLLVATDLARVPVALAFLLARGPDTLWIAFAAVLLLAVGAAVFEPTSSASLPNLVAPEDLPAANVLIGSAWGTMLALGAAVGGVVAVTLGRDAAFIINALSFVLSAVLIVGIRSPLQQPRDPAQRRAMRLTEAIETTIRFARPRRNVASFLLTKTSFGIGTGIVGLLAVFGRDVFGAGDVGIGVLFAARGLGALVGPFLARSIMGTDDAGLIRAIGLSFVVLTVCYALFPLAPGIGVAALLVFGAHCGGGAQWSASSLGLQRATPDAIRGRVFSVDYGLVTLTIACSTLLAGVLADLAPPRVAAWTMVSLVAVAGAAWFAFSRPALRPRSSTGGLALDGPMTTNPHLPFISGEQIRAAVPIVDLIDAVEAAYRDVAAGRDRSPIRSHVELDDGALLLMPGVRHGGAGASVKLVTFIPGNADRGLPTIQALIVWFDATTGRPLALLDGAVVTAMRTGAASGVGTKLLARTDAETLAIIGAGAQAEWQIRAVLAARPIRQVWVYARDRTRRTEFARRMAEAVGVAVSAAASAKEAVREADIVCCATTSNEPVFDAAWLRPGTHVNGIGAFRLGMVELPPPLFHRAAVVAIDSREASLAEAGDVVAAIEAGLVSAADLVELGTVSPDWAASRDPEAITVFKSVGLPIQDVAAVELIAARLL